MDAIFLPDSGDCLCPRDGAGAAPASHLRQVVAAGRAGARGRVGVQDPLLPVQTHVRVCQNQISWRLKIKAPQHLNEAEQGPPGVSDAPLPVFAARPPCQTFELGGGEPLLVVPDAATFTP